MSSGASQLLVFAVSIVCTGCVRGTLPDAEQELSELQAGAFAKQAIEFHLHAIARSDSQQFACEVDRNSYRGVVSLCGDLVRVGIELEDMCLATQTSPIGLDGGALFVFDRPFNRVHWYERKSGRRVRHGNAGLCDGRNAPMPNYASRVILFGEMAGRSDAGAN